jgi:hypothetical protein
MTNISHCKVAAAVVLLIGATAAFADPGSRSYQSLPALPSASSNASTNSQGEPNANGEKPGNGNGYGHDNSQGLGHEIGLGHGHDSDHNVSPG